MANNNIIKNVMRIAGQRIKNKSLQAKTVTLRNILFLLIALSIFSLSVVFLGINILKRVHRQIFVSADPRILPTAKQIQDYFKYKTPFNIILLGYAGGSHEGTFLTDSIIVANINPKAKSVTLITIPRDLWVKIPTDGETGKYWKINAAYALGLDDNYQNKLPRYKGLAGGGNLVKDVLGEILDLQIRNFVALDFLGFQKTIDTLGGVEVNVEKTLDDFEYPVEGMETDLCGNDPLVVESLIKEATFSALQIFPCRYKLVHFDKGLRHLNGKQALEYVRSRHAVQDGGDFSRSQRQRNLILAVKEKVISLNFAPKALAFIDSLKDSLRTDLTFEDMRTLVSYSDEIRNYHLISIALTDQNYLTLTFSEDGQSILSPRQGRDDWSAIRNWISSAVYPEVTLKFPVVKIVNSTKIAGIGEKTANLFKEGPITIASVVNGQAYDIEKTSINVYNNKIDKSIIGTILDVLMIDKEHVKYPEDSEIYDIIINLGQDFKTY